MGDFNAILRGEDRNTTVMDAEIREFEILMTNAGLYELKTIGRFFTWTDSHVHSKIDRALVNGAWMSKWPHLEMEIKDPHFSDHSLLCGRVQRCPMEKIWKKLKLMKGAMKELNSREFSNAETKVQSFRKQLEDVQILLRTSLTSLTDQQVYDKEKEIN
ncbi:hypothetical protein P3L10_007194 [Capsicum annuum]